MGGESEFWKDELCGAVLFLVLVPDTESIAIPEQDFDPIAIAIRE